LNLKAKFFNLSAASRVAFPVRHFFMAGLISLLLLAGCLEATKEDNVKEPKYFTDLKPIDPQPSESSIRPGLKVWYFEEFYLKHIDEMPKGDPPFDWGFEGEPIPILDKKFKLTENFYGSGYHRGISCVITGLIKFSEAGEYILVANANDGIRVWVGEEVVLNDPYWHATGDELTPEAHVTISEPEAKLAISTPGWYRFKIKFFQRKGTATLQMFWKKPGDKEFSFIPAEAYAHIADTPS
jgi:hypothetical protein